MLVKGATGGKGSPLGFVLWNWHILIDLTGEAVWTYYRTLTRGVQAGCFKCLGPYSIWRYHVIIIEKQCRKLWMKDGCKISTMGIPLSVRRHIYIKSTHPQHHPTHPRGFGTRMFMSLYKEYVSSIQTFLAKGYAANLMGNSSDMTSGTKQYCVRQDPY